ncbi:MAG: DUF177 domain-containing protein [Bacteroidota bacterium]
MSGLQINISKLAEGVHHYSLETEPREIELGERFTTTVRVRVELEKSAGSLVLRGELHTLGEFTCDRCLEEFGKEVATTYSVAYLPEGRMPEDSEEKGELQPLSPFTNMLDLGEDVRQYLLLALPIKMLCRDDCLGLCPVCGTNRNRNVCQCSAEEIDSRWSGLKDLFEN